MFNQNECVKKSFCACFHDENEPGIWVKVYVIDSFLSPEAGGGSLLRARES
jgi:hypothetical protein